VNLNFPTLVVPSNPSVVSFQESTAPIPICLEEFLDFIKGDVEDFIGTFMEILRSDKPNSETIVD
jgi:hypothetical protein